MTKKKRHSLKDFRKARYNPRSITESALKALDKSIEEFGDLACIVINRRNNTIVAGHQRITTLNAKRTSITTHPFEDAYGTVEQGHIEVLTERGIIRLPLRIVNWDSRTEKLANIAANNHGGKFDNEKLSKLLAELDASSTFDVELSGFSDGEFQNIIRKHDATAKNQKYVRKLTSPVYATTSKRAPKVHELFDRTKTKELQAKIKEASLPKEIQNYLLFSAERHTKFRFDLAAEYYAHADPEIQELMEDCAMVIVDYNKAIEHGYLKLTEEIMDMVTDG